MSQVQVSVITPIYNGEKYLEECIDSILGQTFKEFELICVDDGSTDRTNEILDRYSALDERVHVFHQKNQYAGIARNTGMDHAKGKYVLFLDADDFFEKNMIQKMYEQIEEDGAEICVCDGYQYDDQNKVSMNGKGYLNKKRLPNIIPFSIKDAEEVIFNFTTMHLYNKLFQFDFIKKNGIRFKPYRLGEDAGFVLHALSAAQKITVVPERLFHYRINTGISVTDSASKDILAGYETLREAKAELEQRGVYTEKVRRSFANKALGNCMHFFRKANTLEAFCTLFNKLILEGGGTELDIIDYGKDYYYVEKNYSNYHRMLEYKDPFKYLFDIYLDAKCASENQRAQLAGIKQELKEVKKVIKEKEKQINEKNEKIEALRHSKTFLIGKAILWLPRKIWGHK